MDGTVRRDMHDDMCLTIQAPLQRPFLASFWFKATPPNNPPPATFHDANDNDDSFSPVQDNKTTPFIST
jgi:hypothetical protein